MTLFGQRIMVIPENTTKTEGGFEIPQEEQDKGQVGVVELFSDDCVQDYKVGDKVFYDKNMVLEMTINGEKKYVLDEQDVFGKL